MPEELRSNYALVYKTRNASQHASPEAPRIINFSTNGRVYMATTGRSDVSGGNTFEFLIQDKKGNFRPISAAYTAEKGWVLDRNPQLCKSCHGKVVRPIWDAYPYWPGVYGSDHDQLKKLSSAPLGPGDAVAFKQSNELKELAGFLVKNARENRYQHLKGLQNKSYYTLADSNAYLSDVTSRAHARQLLTKLFDHPEFHRYQSWFFKTFFHARPDFEPDLMGLRSLNTKQSKELFSQGVEYYRRIQDRFSRIDPGVIHRFESRVFVRDGSEFYSPIFAMFEKLGIPDDYLKTRLQETQVFQSASASTWQILWAEAVEQLKARDPEFAKWVLPANLQNGLPSLRGETELTYFTPDYRIPPGEIKFSNIPNIVSDLEATQRAAAYLAKIPYLISPPLEPDAKQIALVRPMPPQAAPPPPFAPAPSKSCVSRVKSALRQILKLGPISR